MGTTASRAGADPESVALPRVARWRASADREVGADRVGDVDHDLVHSLSAALTAPPSRDRYGDPRRLPICTDMVSSTMASTVSGSTVPVEELIGARSGLPARSGHARDDVGIRESSTAASPSKPAAVLECRGDPKLRPGLVLITAPKRAEPGSRRLLSQGGNAWHTRGRGRRPLEACGSRGSLSVTRAIDHIPYQKYDIADQRARPDVGWLRHRESQPRPIGGGGIVGRAASPRVGQARVVSRRAFELEWLTDLVVWLPPRSSLRVRVRGTTACVVQIA